MINSKTYFYSISLMLMCTINFVCMGQDSPTKWQTTAWEVTPATPQGMNSDSLEVDVKENPATEKDHIVPWSYVQIRYLILN